MPDFKPLGFAKEIIRKGGHVNQYFSRDNYSQIIQDDLVVGFIKPKEYNILKSDPEFEEVRLPANIVKEYRAIRVVMLPRNTS